jgi:leader peptidase (prepilin peptidase)/N-methyltransferase
MNLISAADGLWLVLAFTVGLLIGTVVSVIAHRLPIMMDNAWRQGPGGEEDRAEAARYDLLFPSSACIYCSERIPFRFKVPVVGYCLSRAHCRQCGEVIPLRYLVLEVLGGLLAVSAMLRFGPGVEFVFALILAGALLALTCIDLDFQLLPDAITLPLLWIGLILSVFDVYTDSHQSILGAAVGYGIFWSLHAIFLKLTGKEGLGRGDFKLLAALGAWLGVQSVPLVVLLSSVTGSLVGLVLLFAGRHGRQDPIPFGPFLALAGWATLLFGGDLIKAYTSFY